MADKYLEEEVKNIEEALREELETSLKQDPELQHFFSQKRLTITIEYPELVTFKWEDKNEQ